MQSGSHYPIAELVENDVLVRRRNMRRLRRIGSLLAQAENQTKKTMKQANQSAEAIKAAAWQEGYCQGLQMAAGSLISFMGDYQKWSQRMEQRMHEQLSRQLHQLFSNASVLPDLLKAFCSTVDADAQRITLILPEAWRKTVLTIKARLTEITPCPLDYQYHSHSFCILKAGDQLIDFDAGLITNTLSSRLIDKNICRKQCYQISGKYLQHIKLAVNQQIDSLLIPLHESEGRDDESKHV